jgi:hypothetical protein
MAVGSAGGAAFDLFSLMLLLVAAVALVVLLVVPPWLLHRDQGQLEEALDELRRDIERLDRRRAAELREALQRLATLEAQSLRRSVSEPPSPTSTPTAPEAPRTVEQMIAEASEALHSAAKFDAFAERWSAYGCELWTPGAGSGPLRSDGPASRADLCLILSTEPGLAYALPAFGLVRQLTYLTSDNGRPAQERLGALFAVRRGRHFRPLCAAELDPQTGALRARGELELPLD